MARDLTVCPSWGDHPDNPEVALEPGYFGVDYPKVKSYVHRDTYGVVHVSAGSSKDSTRVVVLGKGNRTLHPEETAAIAGLAGEGSVKYEGGLVPFEGTDPAVFVAEVDEQEVPDDDIGGPVVVEETVNHEDGPSKP